VFEIRTRRVEINGREHDFYYLPHPGAVAIAAVQDGAIALIRQLRPSIEQRIWEVPAGTLEPGEDPAVCAARELAEETGYRAKKLSHLLSFYVAPGYSTEYLHLFLAQELTPGEQSLDESESIDEVAWIPLDEARKMIRDGRIVDAKSIIAIQCVHQWNIA
jgi:ADP-ribose pyrophosphatase